MWMCLIVVGEGFSHYPVKLSLGHILGAVCAPVDGLWTAVLRVTPEVARDAGDAPAPMVIQEPGEPVAVDSDSTAHPGGELCPMPLYGRERGFRPLAPNALVD